MTRTNPSKTKPRMDKTTDRKQADRKQIIFTEGAKGGGGKTTLLSSLADFFLAESIPVKLVDADIDNKSRGSLSHLFRGTPKIDIRTDHGLDQFIGLVLDDNAQTVLADLGAGSSKETWAWFEQMHESVREEGIRVLIMVLHQTHIDHEHAKAPEARLARDLGAIGGSIGYDVSPDGRSIALQVFPGQTWKVRSAQTDAQGRGAITLTTQLEVAHESK